MASEHGKLRREPPEPPASRTARAAAALRENLRKRKAQQRGRMGAEGERGAWPQDAPAEPGGLHPADRSHIKGQPDGMPEKAGER